MGFIARTRLGQPDVGARLANNSTISFDCCGDVNSLEIFQLDFSRRFKFELDKFEDSQKTKS